MAQSDIVQSGNVLRSICVLAGVTATNGQPATANDGVPGQATNILAAADQGANYSGRAARESSLFVKAVGSGGTVACTIRLWGFLAALGEWVPVGTGADTTKGIINAGTSMGATKTNKVLHAEPFYLAGHFDRLYAEVTAITGTGTAVEVWLTTARELSA